MAKTVKYDATKMGPLSWRQLQLANQEAYANLDIDDDLRSALQQVTNNMSIPNSGSPEINWEGRVQSPIMRNSNGRDYWGKSMWDEQVADANDFENNLSDLRGQNQPWYAQLGAGVLKGVTTFATTWLDGTIGLLYGVGSAIRNGDEKTGWDRTAQIFHNDVSNALQDFNEYMEEVAPNYKSRDEENNKWYQNLGTMNFLADGLIKNLGFTVGAFYSGGLFTKGLKLAGGAFNAIKAGRAARAYKAAKIEELVKAGMSAEEAAKAVNPMATAIKYNNTLKALEGAQSGTGAAVAGSLFSAVNEGRIEANQVYRDAFTNTGDWRTSKGAAQEILMNEERVMREIAANPNLTEDEKAVLQQQTRDRADALLKQAEQNAAQAGMLTLGLNIPILTLDNFKMFGRLYSRGFKQSAKQVGNNVITKEMKAAQEAVKNATTKQEKKAAQQALREAERKAKAAHYARNRATVDDVAENVAENEGKLAWNEITTGQKLWRGTKMGLMEGNEEMAQAFVSSTAGAMTMPEDPNAYYKALTDPNATIKTNDFLTSVTKGFLDSYGNGDRWEEGAIGFLTGILGMPTFGARANSDSNTYLGRGKMIGLSGGLFGEFSNANYLNRLGAESVKNINAFRDRYKQHAQFLAQSQAFTDAMDGYLQDKNEFAYNNARDNDDFAMIQALAVTGRLDEAKGMINFDVDKLTDEDLRSIATDFTANRGAFFTPEGKPITTDEKGQPLQGAWRDANGNLMSETEEGKAEMKRLLKEKQETLNTEIDDYVASLDSVRAQVNNSLDESQVRELAWIDWKGKQWSRRFDESVHNGNFINAVDTLASNAQNLMDQMSSEKNFTENKEYKALKNFSELLSKVKTAKNPMELIGIMGKNNAFYNALFDSIYNNNPDAEVTEKLPLIALLGGVDGSLNAVNEIGKTLADIRFMATAQQQFKKKLDEYLSNPTKLAENRARIDNERQQQQDITETINNKPQDLDSNKLRSFLDMDEDSFKQWEASASMPSGISGISEEEKAMVTEASKMRKTYQRLLANINSNTKLSAEEKKQVAALVTASYNKATSYENFLDTSNEAYNDPNNALVDAEGLNSTEIANLKQSIIDKNQQVLSELIGDLDRMPDLPKTGETVGGNIQGTFSTTPTTTGNSQVSTPSESENERVEREKKEKEKKELDKNRKNKLNDYIHELAEVFAADKRDTARMWLWDIANGFINSYLKNGEFPKVNPAVSGAKASKAFEGLLSLCENESQKQWLNNRLIDKLYLRVSQLYNPVVIAQLEKEAAEAVKREQARDKKEKENPVTHIVTVEEIEEINNRELAKHNAEPKDMTYWKPTTTEYGIGQAYEKGNYTKFSDRAASMNYDEKTKRRIAAVSQYFNDNGVWDRVNSGNNGKMDVSSKESVVYFKIDPELNEAAGEIVILITDKDGNVLGDIMSKNDGRFAKQNYLPNFVAYVEEQYKGHENDGSPFVPVNTTTGKPLATKINKCMIGKVPYSNDYVTLNEANDTTIEDTNKQHKYFLGIAVTDNNGKTIVKATSEKAGSLGYIDRMIEQPVGDIVSGTPFLLVKSEGRDVYMCVPFITPVFDEEHYQEIMDSLYGSVIRKAISEIEKTVKNDKIAQKNKPYKIKDILTELFASSKFYVDYNSSTNTYTFKLEGADFYANVSFEDNPAEGQLKFSVSDFLQNIAKKGLGLQISRRYINGNEPRYDENGQVYFNKALGSIAKVNIKPMSQIQSNNSGHTSYLHTIDDWFVIDPLDIQTVNGTVTIKRVQAVAPVSTKNNPNAKPKTIVNVVVDNTPVKVDLENKTATVGNTTFSLKNSKAYSEKDKEQIKKAKIAYAKAFAEAHPNSIKSNIITTPFGEFDTKNNAFTNDTSASDNDNGLGEVDDNFFADLAGVKQQGQKAGTFNSQVQSTPTTTTQTTTEQQPTNGEKSYAEKSGFVFRPVDDYKQEHSLIQVYSDGSTVDTLQFRSEVEAKRVALTMLTMFKSAKDYQDLHDKVRSKGWSMPVTDWTTTYGYWEAFKDGRISEQDVLDLFTPNSNGRVSVPTSTKQETVKQASNTSLSFLSNINPNNPNDFVEGLNRIDPNGEVITEEYEDRTISFTSIEHLMQYIRASYANYYETDADSTVSDAEYERMLESVLQAKSAEEAKKIVDAVKYSKEALERWKKYEPKYRDFLTSYAEREKNTQQTSEQQSTQVNEQAPSTEIAQGETVQEPTPQETKQEVEQKPEPTAEEVLEKKSEESLDKRAEDFGLFDIEGGKGRKVWNVLSDEQKEAIVSKDNLQAVAALECLCTLFDGKKGKFKKKNTDVDGVIAKYKRVTDQPTTLWNKEQEIAWLKKALPQFSNEERLQIVDGLIKIADKDNPGYAYGQYVNALITIGSQAASGTLYHEAFHAVVDALLTEQEYTDLFDAALKVYGNLGKLGLEEKLAEEFRKFIQNEGAAFIDYMDANDINMPIVKGIVRFFRRLWTRIKSLRDKTVYLNKLFYDINRGKFADRKVQEGRNLQPKFDINERELEDIKKKAIADGTFMKAPNGKPTNLNERQWLQVRTKAFKDWFGDWEKAAKDNASIGIQNKELTQNNKLDEDVAYGRMIYLYLANNEAIYHAITNKDSYFKEVASGIEHSLVTMDLYNEIADIVARRQSGVDISYAANTFDKYNVGVYTSTYGLIVEACARLYPDERKKYSQALSRNVHEGKLDEEGYKADKKPYEDRIKIARELFSDLTKYFENNSLKEKVKENNSIKAIQINNSVSKVVDENGEPLVVYNASPTTVTTYKEGVNFFSSDINYVKSHKATDPYTDEEVEVGYGKNVNGVFLNIKNPKVLGENDGLNTSMAEYILKRNPDVDGIIGHDAMFNDNIDLGWVSEGTEYVTSNPNQIKSATENVGTFSRENNDIRYSRVKTELDNKVAEFAEAINKSIAETITLNRYAQNWDYVNKGIPVRKPDASNNDGRKAYFGIKNPMHFYKGQWTISNGASKKGGKSYHTAVYDKVRQILGNTGLLNDFDRTFDVTWNENIKHYVITLKEPETMAILDDFIDSYSAIPDDVMADMMVQEEEQQKTRVEEILNGASSHTTALFEGKTKTNLGRLFENLINAGVNRNKVDLYRNIFDKLGELKNLEVEITDNKDSRFIGNNIAGRYEAGSNSIILLNNLPDYFLDDSIVHEALHAIVHNTTIDKEKQKEVNIIVEGIRKAVLEEYNVKSIDDIQDAYTRRLFYGLTNADEFVSEFFANSEFHSYVKNRQSTWYNKFIEFIKDILGLNVDITRILRNLLADFDGTIKANRESLKLQNEGKSILASIRNVVKENSEPKQQEEQEPDIKQYHIEKLMYENLSESDKEYIKEKGLSKTEYDEFSMAEKESFWYCR